jgi:zinc transport system ATP-binding protein
MNLITIRDLRVELGGMPILRGVDADLVRGQISAVIGLNGSGKTTLLRALVKEVPYAGKITFHCGHDHTRPDPQHVGYVPQQLRIEAQLPLTVLDLFALSLQRRPLFLGIGSKLRSRVQELLHTVGMEHRLNAPVDKLSGGERQRVLLALALEPRPELLLLDEPAAGIDFQEEQGFYDLIGSLNRQLGMTVLLVSHDLTMVSRFVHQVLCLQDGRIKCRGVPQEVLTPEVLADIFGTGKMVYSHSHQEDDKVTR